MTDMYENFEDSDESDDDVGALGSILSWDDDEDNGGRTSSDAYDTSAAAARAAGLPPNLVSFANLKDGNGQQYSIPQLTAMVNNANNSNNALLNSLSNSNRNQSDTNSNGLQVPMPTSMNFSQQPGQTNNSQQQQQLLVAAAQNAQNMSQQNGFLFQQNGQILQAAARQPSQQAQQQQQPQQSQQQPTLSIRPAMPQMVVPQAPQQAQGQQQQLQQQAAQFALTGDATAFLRQLQVAHLQQQLNAAQQQQGGAIQQVLGAAPQQGQPQVQQSQLQQVQVQQMQQQTQQSLQQVQQQTQQNLQQQAQQNLQQQAQQNMQQAALQQQLQQLQQRALAAVPQSQPQVGPAPTAAFAIAKKASQCKPPRSKTAARKKTPPAVGVVSASDTDGELSNRGGPKKKAAAASVASARKRKAVLEPDPDPDFDDFSDVNPTEKTKSNRDRNREHARNTRLRKKAYLEKLKATVDELCKERDTLVSERAGAANLLVEMHNTRTEVLMSFFALRSTNEKRRKLWASILDESCFACVMPVTPYRSFPASEVQVSKCQRTVLGIDGMMADTASLYVLLSSLVDRARFPNGKIEFCYTLVTEEAVVAGNQMMARWVMSTLNATQLGARMEVAKQGMLCCKFNSAHRITGLELMFDVMALMLQLKQAAGSDSFSVIPNTVQTCQRSFNKPMVMTLAEGPYTVVQVNQLWEDMTGYKAEEVVGKASCSILQGPATDKQSVEELMNEIRFKRAASTLFVNYTKGGERFRNFVIVYPLSTDSRITHYLALTSYTERIDGNATDASDTAVAAPQPIAAASGTDLSGNVAAAGQVQSMMQSNGFHVQNSQGQGTTVPGMFVQNNMISTSAVAGQMLPPSAVMNVSQQFSVETTDAAI